MALVLSASSSPGLVNTPFPAKRLADIEQGQKQLNATIAILALQMIELSARTERVEMLIPPPPAAPPPSPVSPPPSVFNAALVLGSSGAADPHLLDGGGWTPFWWYTVGATWPSGQLRLFPDAAGSCSNDAAICLSKLPADLVEDGAQMLAADSSGTVFKFVFNSGNNVATKMFAALQSDTDGTQANGNAWAPTALVGMAHSSSTDYFVTTHPTHPLHLCTETHLLRDTLTPRPPLTSPCV